MRARRRGSRAAGELRGDRARFGGDPPGDEPREQRPGDHRSGEADDQRVKQGPARVGVELRHRGDRSGVRRHQPMGRRETGHERKSELQQRHAGLLHDREQHGGEQHQADLKKHRQPDHEAGEQHPQSSRRSPSARINAVDTTADPPDSAAACRSRSPARSPSPRIPACRRRPTGTTA